MKYRKKPVVIEAFQYRGILTGIDGAPPVPEWAAKALDDDVLYFDGTELMIKTLEGPMHASIDDYIIKGVDNELYACKPDIFERTYAHADAGFMGSDLLTLLLGDLAPAVQTLADKGARIIIDGDRSKPTGKSTLCAYLKMIGADACETWELEEGGKKLDINPDGNSVDIVIWLNNAFDLGKCRSVPKAPDGFTDRKAEYLYLKAFAKESCFDNETCRDQLRCLWVAYCFHHELIMDTSEYDSDLMELWNVLAKTGGGASEWEDYDGFYHFLSKYLA